MFKNFIIKEIKHIIRDTRTLIIAVLIPVLLLIVFGYVISTDIKNVNIAVYDQSNDYQSQRLVSKMASSGYFVPVMIIKSRDEIDAAFRRGKVKMVLAIGSNFAHTLAVKGIADVQIITDASEPNIANIIGSFAQAVISSFVVENNPSAHIKPPPLSIETRMLYNSEMKAVFMFVPGTMVLILMLITAMLTSVSITREKELGTMEVLLVSPLRPWQIIFGKVLPYIVLAMINAIVIIVMGVVVFGLPIRGSIPLLFLVCLQFIMLALALGIFVSSVSKTQTVALFISMIVLMLPTIILSGFIFPLENMHMILQVISYILPPRHFLSALKTIMIKGQGFMFVWKELAIMAGMTAFYIAFSIKKFKIRLE